MKVPLGMGLLFSTWGLKNSQQIKSISGRNLQLAAVSLGLEPISGKRDDLQIVLHLQLKKFVHKFMTLS